MGKHSFVFSGIAKSKTVDMNIKDGKTYLKAKDGKSTKLSMHYRKSATAVTDETAGNFHRQDLEKFALARFHKLNKARQIRGNFCKQRKMKLGRTNSKA
jgi:hypothetical protein